MTFNEFIKWLPAVSALVAALVSIFGILSALREYKLKVQAEVRLVEASRVESDVKLLKLFSEIMEIAHGRGQSYVASEKLFEVLWESLKQQGHQDPYSAAVVTLPVGSAAQDAAIAAIGQLGRKHPLLRPMAIQGLESLMHFKGPVATKHLVELQK